MPQMTLQRGGTRVAEPIASWLPAPDALVLGRDEVHVWRAVLDVSASLCHVLLRMLSEDERKRGARFRFEKDRERFIARRGLLRIVLGRYLAVQPSQLEFCYGAYGKPALAKGFGHGDLRFNVSHSDGLALYAMSCGREVGIDIERVRPDRGDVQIAERFFSPREVAVLRALPAAMRKQAFFECWTRKEAYIKAVGKGLSLPLSGFDVAFGPGEPAALLSARGDPGEASRWSLRELDVGRGYVAALAVEGHSWRLRCWQRPGAHWRTRFRAVG